AFVHNQVFSPNYQATSDPRLGGYEAIGLALAELSPVVSTANGKSDAEFVAQRYSSIFGRAASAAQTAHFVNQVDHFEALYIGAGIDAAASAGKARGAAFGQMLGYAAKETGNPYLIEAEQTLIGYLKAVGGADWMA